jgi:hypothetical protein
MSMDFVNIWGVIKLKRKLLVKKGHNSVKILNSYLPLSTGWGHDGEQVCKVSKPYVNGLWKYFEVSQNL